MRFLACLVAISFALGLHGADVGSEHPRLWITGQAGIDALKKRVADIPKVKEHYEVIKNWAKSGNVNTGNLWLAGAQMCSLGVAYLVEDRDKAILANIKKCADACLAQKPDFWLDAQAMKGLAFAYDWCYQDLTPDERTAYVQKMAAISKQMESRWRHSDYNNHIYVEWGPMIFAAIACKGDGIDDAVADHMMSWSREFIFEHGVKTVNQLSGPKNDGGWHEGAGYHTFFWAEMCQQWEAWRCATSEDPFKACEGMKGDATWMLHANRPHDQSHVEIADTRTYKDPSKLGAGETAYMPLTAARYQDGVAQYLVETIPPSQYAFNRYSYVLWYDPTVKPIELKSQPTAHVFRGLGWGVMRSSWDQDATFALLTSGNYHAGHQHSDQNALLIHKLGNLAIDACEYGAKDSKYHNTIQIGGSQRLWGNDPLQRVRPIEQIDGKSDNDCGDLLAWENQEPHYTYVCGEASNAYPKGQVSWFSRQVVYCRPDIFIVFDRTDTPEPQPREWLLHSIDPAQIDGSEVVITNASGRLWAKQVLPAAAKIAQEPITGGVDNVTHNNISIVPEKNDEKSLNFITVFRASEAQDVAKPKIELVGDNGVTVTQGSTTWKVTFGKEGKPSGHVTITDGGAKKCDRDLTQKLE